LRRNGTSPELPERFGITQPPLSQQIHLLQQEMEHFSSAALRGVELTDAGAVLLKETRRILGQVEQVKACKAGCESALHLPPHRRPTPMQGQI
jgi:DNA-binding transcriptional LysR family regulator